MRLNAHSLEDRLVKEYFKEAASKGEESELSIINKKPIIATNTELDINPRARSAKLRAAIRDWSKQKHKKGGKMPKQIMVANKSRKQTIKVHFR